MTVTIQPQALSGALPAIPSKSAAHRMLIGAALGDKPCDLTLGGMSQDMEATIRCLTALGASFTQTETGWHIIPLNRKARSQSALLRCGESGSTLRFLVPVAAALGGNTLFYMEGRLPQRPLTPLSRELASHGCTLRFLPELGAWQVAGQLTPGDYSLPGDVSSQYLTGLLLALPLLEGESTITLTSPLESAPYVDLTEKVLAQFGVTPRRTPTGWQVSPAPYRSPQTLKVEGDWSNAAPWLCMGALGGEGISVTGLDLTSSQGDRGVCQVLAQMGAIVTQEGDAAAAHTAPRRGISIDGGDIPDLIPPLAAVAALTPGETVVYHAARLRLKESDRLAGVRQVLGGLGADVEETEDGLLIRGKPTLPGGKVDSLNDHRLAMAAAVASVGCTGPVTITTAQAVEKSYPHFWKDFARLGGQLVQEGEGSTP